MKKLYFLIFILVFNFTNAQSERTLEETKTYIVKMINDYSWKENSFFATKTRTQATFEENLLRIVEMNNENKPINHGMVYNFANVYRFKYPIKKPGDVGILIIWVDFLLNKRTGKWKKEALELEIHNYQVAEQLFVAFTHLNKLLLENKPAVEKF